MAEIFIFKTKQFYKTCTIRSIELTNTLLITQCANERIKQINANKLGRQYRILSVSSFY